MIPNETLETTNNQMLILSIQEHPTSCSAKKLFYSGYFARKIYLVLFVVGKVKYIC